MKRWLVAGALALVAVWALWTLLRRGGPETDEARIGALVTELAEQATKKDVGEMIDHVSDAYRDADGLDRQELKRYLAAMLFRADWTEVVITSRSVNVEGPRATAELSAVLARGRSASGDVDPGLSVGAHRITLKLEREGAEWKIVSAEHRSADARELLGR
jgi:hypothetical protein